MAGKERRYFPGNNTPEGFFSYYSYILSQKEADKIICIKGGPGVGKSTFMKKIGQELLEEGYDIDFLHCSSDPGSLDGIILKEKKIALIDATAPHIVDPINPGAVDTIIHLGDYWNEEGIRLNKDALIDNNERIGKIFKRAYNYIAAAGNMYDNIASAYDDRVKKGEIYKIAAGLIGDELAHKELSAQMGTAKKFFASALTPEGYKHFIPSLVKDSEKVYIISAPIGLSGEQILNLFMESALYRGFDVEAYYCPMKPSDKLEHLIVPALKVSIVTSNEYHEVKDDDVSGNVFKIDLGNVIGDEKPAWGEEIREDSIKRMKEMLDRGLDCLKYAKSEHDKLEEYYIPNMDFDKVEKLRKEVLEHIRNR